MSHDTNIITSHLTEFPFKVGGTPKAWWATTDPSMIEAAKRFHEESEKWHVRLADLADKLDCDSDKYAVSTAFGVPRLVGLTLKVTGSKPPVGWLVNRFGNLVPRETKKPRPEVIEYHEMRDVPHINKFLPSTPSALMADRTDGSLGGVCAPLHVREVGDGMLIMVCGVDPSAEESREAAISPLWERMPMQEWHRILGS